MEVGDAFALLLDGDMYDDSYRVFFCSQIHKSKGAIVFNLTPTTYNSKDKPTLEHLVQESFYGKHGSPSKDYSVDYIRKFQPGIEKIWNAYQYEIPYFFSVYTITVSRKDFKLIEDSFIYVGNLSIQKGVTGITSGGCLLSKDINETKRFFYWLDGRPELSNQNKYPLEIILV